MRTVFVSSHDIAEIEQLADHVGMIDGGRLQLSEPTEVLQARFRRIEVTLPAGAFSSSLSDFPSSWLAPEQSGQLLRFIDSRFDATATEAACRIRFPDAAISAHPMSLREIFVALARAKRPAALSHS